MPSPQSTNLYLIYDGREAFWVARFLSGLCTFQAIGPGPAVRPNPDSAKMTSVFTFWNASRWCIREASVWTGVEEMKGHFGTDGRRRTGAKLL